jgi:hypothetical protein
MENNTPATTAVATPLNVPINIIGIANVNKMSQNA